MSLSLLVELELIWLMGLQYAPAAVGVAVQRAAAQTSQRQRPKVPTLSVCPQQLF